MTKQLNAINEWVQLNTPFGASLEAGQATAHELRCSLNAACDFLPHMSATLDMLFNKLEAAEYFKYHDSNSESTEAMMGSLSLWLSQASDKELGDFASWNVGRHSQLAQSLLRDKSDLDLGAEEDVKQLVDQGLLPALAPKIYRQRALHTGEFLGLDIFKQAVLGIEAEYSRINGKISLGNLYDDPRAMQNISANMQATVLHEKTHSLMPAAYQDKHTWMPGWVNEACASHLERTTLNGQPDKLLPSEREIAGQVYRNERQLLGRILQAEDIALDGLYEAIITRNNKMLDYYGSRFENGFNTAAASPKMRYRQFEETYKVTMSQKDRGLLVAKALSYIEAN